MGQGINLGNTLEAPTEGEWAPAATSAVFDKYKSAGFASVRIPVRWDNHTAQTPPYTVEEAWLARVEEVIGWSVERNLVTIVNTHHEMWLDGAGTAFDKLLPRLTAIWTQAAARFAHFNESLLVFEIFNEPHLMTADDLNKLNAAVLPVIRKSNPTRCVFFGGLQFMNPSWILANPDTLVFPNRSADPYIGLEVHNYDPYDYAGPHPSIKSWGSDADKAQTQRWITELQTWSLKRQLAIIYGEFGVTHAQTAASGRVGWYSFHHKAALAAGFAILVWDDNGDFALLNRTDPSHLSWADPNVVKALGMNPV